MGVNYQQIYQLITLGLKRQTLYTYRLINRRFYHKRYFNPLRRRSASNEFTKESKIANRICITVLGNDAFGQPRCVCVFTEHKSYVFNCGEGIGRLCREYNINLAHMRKIFITHKSWKNLSGLPDILLSQQMLGVPKISLRGPPGIANFTSVVISSKLEIEISNKPLVPPYVDETIEIKGIQISSFKGKEGRNADLAVSYICKVFDKPGQFQIEKCVEHGVPVGPELMNLKNGQSITLPSGKIITPSDVHDGILPGATFLIVDCPSEDFLEPFVRELQLPGEIACAVFHLTPPFLFYSPKYQNWMKRFHEGACHYVLHSDNPLVNSEAIHRTQRLLHMLHPNIFSLLHEDRKVIPESSKVIKAESLLQLHIRPKRELCRANVVTPQPEIYMEEAMSLPGFSEKFQNLKRILKEQTGLKQRYPEVVFLGTSSATSTACRNVSGILVNVSDDESILLDCGEGTFGQMVRLYGPSATLQLLRTLSCVFISHMHTDHYMGLFTLIDARKEAFIRAGKPHVPLALIIPPPVEKVVKIFSEIFNPIMADVKIFSCKFLQEGRRQPQNLQRFLGDVKVNTVAVKHCLESYGIVLKTSDWSIVYSGDSAPCQKLIDAGKNCTLLIHEASIEDDFIREASMKKHCTPQQVVDISEKMNAQFTIMTHFSKRYLAVPVFPECNQRHIACAFDFMKVRLDDLPVLPLMLPALKCLFQEVLESHLERTSSVVSFENVLLKAIKS